MNLSRKLFHLVFGFLCVIPAVFPSSLRAQVTAKEIPPFVLITIPKSGSHLVMKALKFLTGAVPIWHTKFPSLFYIPANDAYLYTHFCLSAELEDDYTYLPELKKIVMIRDLRDVCVSIVNQIRKASWPGMTYAERQEFLAMPFEKQLMFVINFDYDVHEIAASAPDSLQVSVVKIAEQVQRYCDDPRNLVCRYEDLVGPNGGGTLDAQLEELRSLAQFLQVPVSEGALHEVALTLYGNEVNPFGKGNLANMNSTFYKGKIGRWKTVFNEEHKKAFKKKLGPALIALGYEQDNIW